MASLKGKLLVTGGAGFIGRSVVKKALELGYEVRSFDFNECQVKGSESIKGDIRDKTAVLNAAKGVDYIIHLAAVTSPLEFEKDMEGCCNTNIGGTLNVFEIAGQNRCKRVLYASSAAVYIDQFSETTIIPHFRLRNYYAKTKLMDEMLAHSYRDAYGLDVIGLRFFNVYGPGENEKGNYASLITQFISAKQKGERPIVYGDGSQARDHIHVNDAANITMMLLEKGKEEVYNVGTGVPLKYSDIAKMLVDESRIEYVKNPLHSYQMLTKADTTRMLKTIGAYKFIDAREAIKEMEQSYILGK